LGQYDYHKVLIEILLYLLPLTLLKLASTVTVPSAFVRGKKGGKKKSGKKEKKKKDREGEEH